MFRSRPHINQTDDELKESLQEVSRQARERSRTGPKAWEDALHDAANSLLDEMDHRSGNG